MLCQVRNSMSHTVNGDATDAEDLEVDQPSITDQGVVKSQFVAPAASAIEMIQRILITPSKVTDKASVLASSPFEIKNDAIVVNCEEIDKLKTSPA